MVYYARMREVQTVFAGFSSEMIEFFLSLRFNNHLAFFQEHQEAYLRAVQQPLRLFAEAMADTMLEIDPQMDVRPARVVSRIRRDTRFTNNKDPFRDHMWLSWRHAGEARMASVGMYWEVSPEGTHWGFGLYSDNKPIMESVRRRICSQPQEFLALEAACDVPERFVLQGDAYKRLPIPAELPEALHALYRKKSFYYENCARPDDFDSLFFDRIHQRLREDFLRIAPLYRWLRGLVNELAL